MKSLDECCAVAALNTERSVDVAQRLPDQVFTDDWRAFLFFDPDWMREDSFVEAVNLFLDADNGRCAHLRNVDLALTDTTRSSLRIQRGTTREEYRSLLAGDGPADGWVYDMGRLVCASDTGEWVMYSEPADIAVIAFRSPSFESRYQSPVSRINAVRIDAAVEKGGPAHGLSSSDVSILWRTQLLRNYSARA